MTETPQEYDPSNKKPTTPTEPTIIRIVVCPRLQMLYIDTLNEWGAVNSEKTINLTQDDPATSRLQLSISDMVRQVQALLRDRSRPR